MKEYELLEKAATVVEERGWCAGTQGVANAFKPTGEVCILGSIMVAAELKPGGGTDPYADAAEMVPGLLDKALKKLGYTSPLADDDPSLPIYRWNDHYAKGQQEVVDLLRDTAKELRAQEPA